MARLRGSPGIAERVEALRANLVVDIHSLDLALVQSTLSFADEAVPVRVASRLQCGRRAVLEHLVAAPPEGLEGPLGTQPAQFGDDPRLQDPTRGDGER